MTTYQEAIGLAVMASLWMLGVTRVRSMLWGLAIQGGSLAMILLARGIHESLVPETFLGVATLGLKGFAIPIFLNWSACKLGVVRDRGTGLAPGAAMLVGASVLVVCYFQSARFSATGTMSGSAGMTITMVVIGLMIMMTRRLALGMMIGFLVLDNGIFAYSITQTSGLPVVIELGILFDLFMAVLVTGTVLFRVNRSFEHMDVSEMRELRE